MSFPLFPAAASTMASRVDMLFGALVLLSLVILAIVFGPMIYFLFKYRAGRPADRTPLKFSTWKLEITWTLIPTLLGLGIFVWGAQVYYQIQRPPANCLEMHVVGKQWMWKIQHPEGRREIDELHVPVGQNIKLVMVSEDVIHSFFLPAFRVKQDVLPGRYTTVWFKATRPGVYPLFCAEYCGTDHSRMKGKVVVMRPDEFQEWLRSGRPQSSLVDEGERLFRELGCSGCHMGDSQVRAPRLEGLFGKPVPLQDGRVVVADQGYIRDSILLPQKDIAAGYEPLMPAFDQKIKEEDLLKLIAYIQSLSSPKGGLK